MVQATDSRSWKSIIRGRNVLELGARWQIGNGRTVDFWSDWWVGDKPFGLTHKVPDDTSSIKVSELITTTKVWDEEKLKSMLPSDVVREIQTIPIAIEANASDRLIWPGTSSVTFSIRFAITLPQVLWRTAMTLGGFERSIVLRR